MKNEIEAILNFHDEGFFLQLPAYPIPAVCACFWNITLNVHNSILERGDDMRSVCAYKYHIYICIIYVYHKIPEHLSVTEPVYSAACYGTGSAFASRHALSL